MKHIVHFKDGNKVVFANKKKSEIIETTGDENLPQLDAVGEFIRIYTEDGIQFLYPAHDIKSVVSATTAEAEAMLSESG